MSKKFRSAIIIVLLLCEALFGASQSAFALIPEALPENAVIIGFIDSGVAPYHLDETHLLPGKNYVFDAADTVDRIGHGTATAGMVLGSVDGSVKGTFPEAFVVPLVVVDKYPGGAVCDGGTAALVSAIYDAVDVFGCRVINISLCTTDESEALKAAVDYACEKGAIIVCAAGNYGSSRTVYYPAHYDSVISVGSSASAEIADFSRTQDADFFYEGKSVPVVSYQENGQASTDSGTSFSCASVAGICASMLAAEPSLTVEDVRARLRSRCFEGTTILRSDAEAPAAADFRDIVGHWAEAEIEYCVARGIFHGNGDGTFLPDNKMTRAMFVTVLWNLEGRPEAKSGAGFRDVAASAWYAEAVDWAFENGLVMGLSSDEFAPDSFVTREQACVFLMRCAAIRGAVLTGDTTVKFADEDSISDWAKSAVALCASADIVHGYPNQNFVPAGSATRAECCSILYHFCIAAREAEGKG